MSRELTYKVPFGRLMKLSRSASRRVYRSQWLSLRLLFVAYAAVLLALYAKGEILFDALERASIPFPVETAFGSVIALFAIGVILVNRWSRSQMQERIDYEQVVRLTEEDTGLRIRAEHIEYFIEWAGINELMLEPDGVAFSHGSLFFFVPASAFESDADRLAFARDVFARLDPEARERSAPYLAAALIGTNT